MRISNKEAEAKALAIAEKFLLSRDSRGWDWKCVGANPDLSANENKVKKTYIKWSVVVE